MNPLFAVLLLSSAGALLAATGWVSPGSATAAVVGGMALLLADRLRRLQRAVERERAEASPHPSPAPWWSRRAHDTEATIRDLGREAAEGRAARAAVSARWLGLTELWSSLDRAETSSQMDERILRFVRGESGFPGAAILRTHPTSDEVSGTWSRPSDPRRTEPVRWSRQGLGGALIRALQVPRMLHSEQNGADVLVRVNGTRPRLVDPKEPYLVLPLRGATRGGDGDPPVLGALVFLGVPEDSDGLRILARRLEPIVALVASLLEHVDLHRRLLAAERLRDGMLDAMLNGLVGTDSRGRIIFANRRAREMSGGAPWMGQALAEHLSLPSPEAIDRVLVEGIPYSHADARLHRGTEGDAAESSLPVRVSLTPLVPERGGRRGIVCVLEDRSQIQALEDEVRHLDTLAAIGRFASSLAHEIRNPLGGIRAGIGYLDRRSRLDQEQRETIEVIDNEISRLDAILQNLLSVAKPRSVAPELCDPEELCRRAGRSFEALARQRGVQIEIEPSGDLADLRVDRDMIHQVLTNLLKNAIEASPRGGRIRVSLRSARPGQDTSEARGMQVVIEDEGAGIPPEDLGKLFEPFFSRKSGGTGLGLYVCHNFVQRHGGRLWAENVAVSGARFVLELPAAPALIGG